MVRTRLPDGAWLRRIQDLPAPVTASKADWLPGTTWLGFTPQGEGPNAEAQCQSAVRRQFGNGYVLERITQVFGEPNAALADDPQVRAERARHALLKDRLVAVHRLRAAYRPLATIIGQEDFERLQDIWATGRDRRRWSVAFPIIESYEIAGQPRARDVFEDRVFRRIYQSQSALLRPLDHEARGAIASLEIKPKIRRECLDRDRRRDHDGRAIGNLPHLRASDCAGSCWRDGGRN